MNSPTATIFCDNHKNLEVSFFCSKHNILICGNCAFKDHSSHSNEIKEITVDKLKKHSTLLSGHVQAITDQLKKSQEFH